jgi:hypothetical protein
MRSPLCLFLVLWAAACSDSNALPAATVSNLERTETLFSLVGTPVATPSGYTVDGGRRVRTDLTDAFDFAYNVEPDGRHVFVPRGALGIDPKNSVNPGFQARTETFEAIRAAPSNGYVSNQPVPIAIGERYIVRSRVVCSIGVPKYAKLEIVGFDEVARTVTFRVLVDDNCGFKGLQPGLPSS